MNKPIAITPDTILRDAHLFDDAPIGNDVSDTQRPLTCAEPAIVARSEDHAGLLPGESDDTCGDHGPAVLHTAKSDDRCLLPKVRAPYVKPEIVSRELTLKRFNPCDL